MTMTARRKVGGRTHGSARAVAPFEQFLAYEPFIMRAHGRGGGDPVEGEPARELQVDEADDPG